MRAAERFELCRKVGSGNVRLGIFRIAVEERRAARAVDYTVGLREGGPMGRATGAPVQDGQGGSFTACCRAKGAYDTSPGAAVAC